MNLNSKISIAFIAAILCVLIISPVFALGNNEPNAGAAGQANVMSSSSGNLDNIMASLPEVDEQGNVINPSSDNLGNIMASLPEVDEQGNVINPSSDNLGNIMASLPKDEVNVLSEVQTSLWQGQTSQVYRFTLNCPGTVRMTSSYGARFYLYAKKNAGSDPCPSANSLRYNYDKVVYGYSGSTIMNLDPGTWCLMVYGASGSGSYSLRITTSCSTPTPYPTKTPYPTQTPDPCGVYKTDSRQGFLNQGQAAVYGYSIPSDSRSKIVWSMTSSSSQSGGDTPIIIASVGDASTDTSASKGTSVFDLYVFKDCNPKNSQCSTRYFSRGPNSYISVANPSTGSIYYVMAYARSGSGTFTITMNSYKCTGDDTPIIAASADSVSLVSSEGKEIEPVNEVSAPDAEFVISE
jgi:hypothetical protein